MKSAQLMSREELIAEVEYLRDELGVVRDQEIVSALCRRWDLTHKPASVLAALHRTRGRPLTRHAIINAAWSFTDEPPTPRTVDIYISMIRGRLGRGAVVTLIGAGLFHLSGAGVAACDAAIAASAEAARVA